MQNFTTFGTDDFIFCFKIENLTEQLTDLTFEVYDENGNQLENISMTNDPNLIGPMGNMPGCFYCVTSIKRFYTGAQMNLSYYVTVIQGITKYTVLKGMIYVINHSEEANINVDKGDSLYVRVEIDGIASQLTAAEFTVRGQKDTNEAAIIAQGTLANGGVVLLQSDPPKYIYEVRMTPTLLDDLIAGTGRFYDFKVYHGAECHTLFSGVLTIENV